MSTEIEAKYPPDPPEECRYCGSPVHRVEKSDFYRTDELEGALWVCSGCSARVGAHSSGEHEGKPLGILAGEKLRRARRLLHKHFDPIWQEGGTGSLGRQEAYDRILGDFLGLEPSRRHIAMLTLEEATALLRFLRTESGSIDRHVKNCGGKPV